MCLGDNKTLHKRLISFTKIFLRGEQYIGQTRELRMTFYLLSLAECPYNTFNSPSYIPSMDRGPDRVTLSNLYLDEKGTDKLPTNFRSLIKSFRCY